MRLTAVVALVLCTVTTATRLDAQAPDTSAHAGWIRTGSGLECRVVPPGRGRAVVRGDTVTIHEALSLPDGRTVFDSRVAPNKPVTFDPAFIPPTATRLYDIEVLAARP